MASKLISNSVKQAEYPVQRQMEAGMKGSYSKLLLNINKFLVIKINTIIKNNQYEPDPVVRKS